MVNLLDCDQLCMYNTVSKATTKIFTKRYTQKQHKQIKIKFIKVQTNNTGKKTKFNTKK